ncbi:hypothetical protein IAT38_006188 [Cryptococcus sp. DSM 104549]
MATYSGSLTNKRKPELLEIAAALGLTGINDDSRNVEIVKGIQAHLEAKETELLANPQFKGLYYKRRQSSRDGNGTHTPERETASPSRAPDTVDIRKPLASVTKARASINKTLGRVQEAVVDAASVPLPESPIPIAKIQDVAHKAETAVSHALVPAKEVSQDLTTRFQGISQGVAHYTSTGQEAFQVGVRHTRDLLSIPNHLVTGSLLIESISIFSHMVQWYKHTIYFPPPASESGALPSLGHALFFWAPTVTLDVSWPEVKGLGDGDIWTALAWWFVTTVLPPYLLSNVVSFVPQKGVHRHTGAHTRYQDSHPPSPTFDTLVYTFVRLAILVLPLTSAAPTAFVDALEKSGNLQARALGAGLLAALVLASKLSASA